MGHVHLKRGGAAVENDFDWREDLDVIDLGEDLFQAPFELWEVFTEWLDYHQDEPIDIELNEPDLPSRGGFTTPMSRPGMMFRRRDFSTSPVLRRHGG